jgi:hypothetical protein
MIKQIKTPGPAFAAFVFLGVIYVSSAALVVSFPSWLPLLRTAAHYDLILSALDGMDNLVYLNFLVPLVLAVLYSWPVIKACSDRKNFNPSLLAKRRVLNAPLMLGLIMMIGWGIEILVFLGGGIVNGVTRHYPYQN